MAIETKRVAYTLFSNRPNNKKIKKLGKKMAKKGYMLQSRQDNDVGCLMLLLTLGWARGKTELTFVLVPSRD